MAERADRMITVSDTTRKYMQEVDGILKEISVVYLGFDFDLYSPDQANRTRVRDEFGFTDDDLVIGYVAGFAQGKGHKQLIQAFSSIAGELPDAKLFLVGQGDTTESRNLAAELGVGDRVIFTGWRSDAAACLNAMDIFVQPSLSEAFSQVLIEAMGSGLPVIATDVGSAREVIESGENGLLVEADDPGSISRHLVELHRNIELRKTLAKAARESVIERFTVEKMVNDQYHLYNQWLRDQNGI
jgi:glycosyltransferase involved in cell wall biosynthesis